METSELLTQLADRLSTYQVLAEPVTRNGVTVVPVTYVRAGGGLGGRRKNAEAGEGNGGGVGIVARPAGAWVIKGDEVSWQPAIEMNRVILGGQAVAVVALLVAYQFLRRRRTD
jgi:uncharacterized spore protein YtfJ